MQSFIDRLAHMTDAEHFENNRPEPLPDKKLVPPHVEALQPYQPGRPPEDLMKELGLSGFVNLASNENPLGPPDSALAAIIKASARVHRYPTPGGLKLRQVLSERYGVNVDNVAIGSGSESIMANIIRAFLHGDDEALTSEGTFIGFYVLVRAQGVKLKMVPLRNYRFDLNSIASAINDKTKIIYLCNPNNPTGTMFTRKEFDAFIKRVPEHVLVILDEAYYEFAMHNPLFPDSMKYRFDNIITLRTFSKAYGMAGLRLGYGLGHEYLIGFVNRIKLPFEPNMLAEAAGISAFADDDYLHMTLTNNEQGMAYLSAELDRLGLKRVPSNANFIMIDMGGGQRAHKLHQDLLRQGIAIRPLAAFGLPNCVRITIGLPEENEACIKALHKVL